MTMQAAARRRFAVREAARGRGARVIQAAARRKRAMASLEEARAAVTAAQAAWRGRAARRSLGLQTTAATHLQAACRLPLVRLG